MGGLSPELAELSIFVCQLIDGPRSSNVHGQRLRRFGPAAAHVADVNLFESWRVDRHRLDAG